jgi:tetratricopeptide (TPR) repeat protein
MTASPATRLERLLGFLEHDAENPALLADAASAALDAGQPAVTLSLVQRSARVAPPSPELRNLAGLAALRDGQIDQALATFETLRAEGHDDPALRFNLAWCQARNGAWDQAETLLDAATLAAAPEGARLRIQALHHLGRLDEALELGEQRLAAGQTDEPLVAALTLAALDAEAFAKAERYAAMIPDSAPALAAQGLLALNAERAERAEGLFDAALVRAPDDGRALLGKGLSLLALGEYADAALWLDRASQAFESHLGSWIAAGWAHFAAGDLTQARARFETVLALDDTFSEAHGGLAVLDLIEGRVDTAEPRAQRALRLDRQGFSAALATSLLAEQRGDLDTAQRVRDRALNAPAGPGGRTILQSMATIGSRRR